MRIFERIISALLGNGESAVDRIPRRTANRIARLAGPPPTTNRTATAGGQGQAHIVFPAATFVSAFLGLVLAMQHHLASIFLTNRK